MIFDDPKTPPDEPGVPARPGKFWLRRHGATLTLVVVSAVGVALALRAHEMLRTGRSDPAGMDDGARATGPDWPEEDPQAMIRARAAELAGLETLNAPPLELDELPGLEFVSASRQRLAGQTQTQAEFVADGRSGQTWPAVAAALAARGWSPDRAGVPVSEAIVLTRGRESLTVRLHRREFSTTMVFVWVQPAEGPTR